VLKLKLGVTDDLSDVDATAKPNESLLIATR